ncbi:MAG: hypothetical protein ACRDDL_05715 [Sarcina sp.]
MPKTLALTIALGIIIALFFLSHKTGFTKKLTIIISKWTKKLPEMAIHIVGFIINFILIVGVGLTNNIINQAWFTLTVFPLVISISIILTIAVVNTPKIHALENKKNPVKKVNPANKQKIKTTYVSPIDKKAKNIKPTAKKKANRAK